MPPFLDLVRSARLALGAALLAALIACGGGGGGASNVASSTTTSTTAAAGLGGAANTTAGQAATSGSGASASAPAASLLDSAAWGFINGAEFPGASGSLTRLSDASRGTVAQINYDLGCGVTVAQPANGRVCGNYVALNLGLAVPIATTYTGTPTLAMDVLRDNSALSLGLRVIDSTGQVLQFTLPPPPAGNDLAPAWQSVQVDVSMSSNHWSGANDGVLHAPIQALSVLVNAGTPLQPPGHTQVASVRFVDAPTVVPVDTLISAADKARPLGDTLGTVVMFSQGQPLSQLPLLTDLGIRWVRDAIDWASMEPSAGTFVPWPAALTQRLDYYRDHQIGVMVTLCCYNAAAYPPTVAQPLRPYDPVAFGRYAVEVATRLKALGVPFVLELWNEPHNNLKQLGGDWLGRPSSPWMDYYVGLANEVVRQVKAYDPSVPVVTDDDMWVIHYWMLEAGLPAQLDGMTFHPYSPSPERTAISFDTDWTYPFVCVDKDGSFQSAVRRLRAAGNAKLGHVPDLWATEWGWRLGDAAVAGPVTQDLQAAMLPRAYVVAHASGVKATFWFDMIDWNDGPFGLLANDGTQRPAYRAMKTLSQQLGAYTLVRQVLGGNHLTSGTQAYLYQHGNDFKLVIWNLDAAGAVLPLAGALAAATVVDVYGQPAAPQQGASASLQLPLGQAPLYLAGVPNDATLDAALISLQ
jgi:hypothetical protein